jgi:hypothetical protein
VGIEDMIDEVVSEKKKEIDDKLDKISVINMVDFNEPMNLKTWDWLNEDTSLFLMNLAAGILLQRLLRITC